MWSGKRDLNPRPSPWQGDALPLSYSRVSRFPIPPAWPHGPVESEAGYTIGSQVRQAFCVSVAFPRLANMARKARKYTMALHTENAPER
jgi:hypothetical protein